MRRTILLATIAWILAAPPAAAEEVQLGWRTLVNYDSRVARNDDTIFQFGPTLDIDGEWSRASYNVHYEPTYEAYVKNGELSDWRHQLNASGSVALTKRLNLRVTDSFRAASRRRIRDDVDPDVEAEFEGTDENPILTNVLTTTLSANPLPRFSTTFSVSHFYRTVNSTSLVNQDVEALTVIGQSTYQLSEKQSVGGGMSFRRRFAEAGLDVAETDTDTYQAFGIWRWAIDERSTFSARAGPSWASDDVNDDLSLQLVATVPGSPLRLVDASTCASTLDAMDVSGFDATLAVLDASCGTDPSQPDLTPEQQEAAQSLPARDLTSDPDVAGFLFNAQDDGSPNDTTVNVFFNLSLDRRWDRFAVFTSWSRSDSLTQSLGASTLLDTFRLGYNLELGKHLSFSNVFRFSRRFSDVDRTVDLPLIFGPVPLGAVSEIGPGSPLAGLDGSIVIGTIARNTSFQSTNDIYSMQFRFNYRWTRNASLLAGLNLRRQESKLETEFASSSNSNEQWEVEFGFNYRFRPFRL